MPLPSTTTKAAQLTSSDAAPAPPIERSTAINVEIRNRNPDRRSSRDVFDDVLYREVAIHVLAGRRDAKLIAHRLDTTPARVNAVLRDAARFDPIYAEISTAYHGHVTDHMLSERIEADTRLSAGAVRATSNILNLLQMQNKFLESEIERDDAHLPTASLQKEIRETASAVLDIEHRARTGNKGNSNGANVAVFIATDGQARIMDATVDESGVDLSDLDAIEVANVSNTTTVERDA